MRLVACLRCPSVLGDATRGSLDAQVARLAERVISHADDELVVRGARGSRGLTVVIRTCRLDLHRRDPDGSRCSAARFGHRDGLVRDVLSTVPPFVVTVSYAIERAQNPPPSRAWVDVREPCTHFRMPTLANDLALTSILRFDDE